MKPTGILICEMCGMLSGPPYNCDCKKLELTQKLRKMTMYEWSAVQDEPPHPDDVYS